MAELQVEKLLAEMRRVAAVLREEAAWRAKDSVAAALRRWAEQYEAHAFRMEMNGTEGVGAAPVAPSRPCSATAPGDPLAALPLTTAGRRSPAERQDRLS